VKFNQLTVAAGFHVDHFTFADTGQFNQLSGKFVRHVNC